jgi:hypothetical protein
MFLGGGVHGLLGPILARQGLCAAGWEMQTFWGIGFAPPRLGFFPNVTKRDIFVTQVS